VVRKINKELAEKKSESLSETKHEPEDYRNDIQDKTQESEEKMDDSGEEAAEDKANNPNAKKSKFSKFSLRRKKQPRILVLINLNCNLTTKDLMTPIHFK